MAEDRPGRKPAGLDTVAGNERDALDQLGKKIDAARERLEPKRTGQTTKFSKLTLAWRMVLELVVGCALGAGFGYGLDGLVGTRPVFLIIFGGLGLAAGVKTMMASAREVARAGRAADGQATEMKKG